MQTKLIRYIYYRIQLFSISLHPCPGVDHWSSRHRSWVQVLGMAEGLPLSFISLGADSAQQAISQCGKARMQAKSFIRISFLLSSNMSRQVTGQHTLP